MRRLLRYTVVLSALVAISGCGFHLRSAPSLPENVNTVLISSARAHAPLARALHSRLTVYGLNGVYLQDNTSSTDGVSLYLLPEKLERRLLSVYASGQVAEYELIYTVRYRVQFPDEEAIMATFDVMRDYQDDPDQVLAKSRELELVLDEMRAEAADMVIRRLSSQAAAVQ
ncbi:LPS assembly lipoprotein LptE [Alteromonas sp. 1_MG-2023]|jgi:LPS-assembly lipoprotein|uniref:LPS-assembly lipoprotein LptE n=1 Tax=Alteromonas sp. 1_MG-2023 TaxID=3062669 RepID=UPI0026E38B66|nr:LPS assembly lipoprotein LptE [Alteromonas sp. 1_MG-2023]MDO6568110.1 LPS assembly lipoprotein LptE [Alteromonas sp. 1_MG-2023]